MLCDGKKIGSLFFYGGKPHCQNSGQTVGRRESLYNFLRPIELKYVSAALLVMDPPWGISLFYKVTYREVVYRFCYLRKNKLGVSLRIAHSGNTHSFREPEEALPETLPTLCPAVGGKADFNKT